MRFLTLEIIGLRGTQSIGNLCIWCEGGHCRAHLLRAEPACAVLPAVPCLGGRCQFRVWVWGAALGTGTANETPLAKHQPGCSEGQPGRSVPGSSADKSGMCLLQGNVWHSRNQGLARELSSLDMQAASGCSWIGLRQRDFPNSSPTGRPLLSPHPSLSCCFAPSHSQPCSSLPAAEHRSSPPGAVPGQLQLLLFRFKCLHLFITKTPLRFPGSSTGWARELSEKTHGRRLSAKTSPQKHPKTSTRLCPGFGGAGNRAGCLGGALGDLGPSQLGPGRTFPCFLGAFRAGPGCRPHGSLAALTG